MASIPWIRVHQYALKSHKRTDNNELSPLHKNFDLLVRSNHKLKVSHKGERAWFGVDKQHRDFRLSMHLNRALCSKHFDAIYRTVMIHYTVL